MNLSINYVQDEKWLSYDDYTRTLHVGSLDTGHMSHIGIN